MERSAGSVASIMFIQDLIQLICGGRRRGRERGRERGRGGREGGRKGGSKGEEGSKRGREGERERSEGDRRWQISTKKGKLVLAGSYLNRLGHV